MKICINSSSQILYQSFKDYFPNKALFPSFPANCKILMKVGMPLDNTLIQIRFAPNHAYFFLQKPNLVQNLMSITCSFQAMTCTLASVGIVESVLMFIMIILVPNLQISKSNIYFLSQKFYIMTSFPQYIFFRPWVVYFIYSAWWGLCLPSSWLSL